MQPKPWIFTPNFAPRPGSVQTARTQYGYAMREANPFIRYAEWTKGNIAMALGSIDETMFARSIDPELTGMAPVPLSPAGTRASELNSRMMGLYADILIL